MVKDVFKPFDTYEKKNYSHVMLKEINEINSMWLCLSMP